MRIALLSYKPEVAEIAIIENFFVWLRITDEGSVPEMRIWSI